MAEGVMTFEQFAPHAGTAFTIAGVEPCLTLSLIDVVSLRRAEPDRTASFSLVFESADPRILEQCMHRLQHAALRDVDLFLVPIGRTAGGMTYEAVFN